MEFDTLVQTVRDRTGPDDQLVIALSGGVDSGLVAAAAQAAWAGGAHDRPPVAVTVRSELTARTDFERAEAVARHIGIKQVVITARMLDHDQVRRNGPDRCYHCKLALFDRVRERWGDDCVIADGTNHDDDPARPGLRAAREHGVFQPLKDLAIPKEGVRLLARAAGLPNWDAPSESCLATRLGQGTPLTRERLAKVEHLEAFWRGRGVRALRVRHDDMVATVEYSAQYAGIMKQEGDLFSVVIRSVGLEAVRYKEWGA